MVQNGGRLGEQDAVGGQPQPVDVNEIHLVGLDALEEESAQCPASELIDVVRRSPQQAHPGHGEPAYA